MIKHFCDGCSAEITESNACAGGDRVSDRLGTEIQKNGRKLKIEVMLTTDGTANAGDWCKYCVINALSALDDRPREAPQPKRPSVVR